MAWFGRRKRLGPPALLAGLLVGSLSGARANDLSLDKRTMAIDDSVSITVTLTDEFANVDSVDLPLRNLQLDGPPSVSSQFQWINGQSSKSKVLRYSAHALRPGAAVVGPLRLRSGDGRTEMLAAVTLTVLSDATEGSNDPARILHQLLATGRDPIFIVARADRAEAMVGEEVVVTWTLYNAASVEQYGIGTIPRLADFWSEELDVRSEQPETISLDGVAVERLVVRRAALFPLRSGSLTVEPMTVNAVVMKRVNRGDPFGMFEGMQVDVHRRSAPLTILAHPLPAGPPVDVVGSASLRCSPPLQRHGGPVSIDVSLRGKANLRSAPPPQWERPVAGSVQIVERGVKVERTLIDASMTRTWRYLLFPETAGEFRIPPLVSRTMAGDGTRLDLRCAAQTLTVERPPVASEQTGALSTAPRVKGSRWWWPWLGGALAPFWMGMALAWSRRRRQKALAATLMRETPAETRAAVDEHLQRRGLDPAALMREGSDRGDAIRAVRSLLDGEEHGRIEVKENELRDRIHELLRAIAARKSG